MQSTRPIKQGQLQDYISPSTQAALNLKAPLLNPSFSGTVKLLSNVPNGLLTINGVNAIVSLSGTTNLLTKWNASGTLSNSTITDTGAAITLGVVTTVSGNLTATNLIRSGGSNLQYLMADGSVGTLATGGGITNAIPKFTSINGFGNSRLIDDGNYFGISTVNNPLKDIALGYQTNREIGIEQSDSSTVGRDLIIAGGRTTNFAYTTILQPLYTTIGTSLRLVSNVFTDNNNNTYFPYYNKGGGTAGGLLKQTNSLGSNLIELGGMPSLAYVGGCVTNSGDVYLCVVNGDIYKQSGGTGSFVALGQSALSWRSMCSTPNGDVYASVGSTSAWGGVGGDIYKQSGGTGNFIAMGFPARPYCIGASPNGDVYAAVNGGSIYKIVSGSTILTDLVQTARAYYGIAVSSNGLDVYTCVYNGDVYKLTNLTGSFIAMGQVGRGQYGVGISTNYTLSVGVPFGDIYATNVGVLGLPNLQGGTLKLKAGTGKGTGQSRVQIITGQITTSGTNMQTEQIVAQFDESGNTTFYGNVIITGSVSATSYIVSGGTSSQYLMGDGSLSTGPTTLIIGNLITGTTYTLTNTDHAKQLQTTNSSAVIIIVPTGLTSGFACDVIQEGFGQISVSGSTGVTLKYSSFELPTTYEQYSAIGIVSITNLLDTYKLSGQLSSI